VRTAGYLPRKPRKTSEPRGAVRAAGNLRETSGNVGSPGRRVTFVSKSLAGAEVHPASSQGAEVSECCRSTVLGLKLQSGKDWLLPESCERLLQLLPTHGQSDVCCCRKRGARRSCKCTGPGSGFSGTSDPGPRPAATTCPSRPFCCWYTECWLVSGVGRTKGLASRVG
jgi:hypothetical protein